MGEEIQITTLLDMQVVSLKPGDVVVLSHPNRLSDRVVERLTASLKNFFPDNRRVVLEENMQLGVARKEDVAGAE